MCVCEVYIIPIALSIYLKQIPLFPQRVNIDGTVELTNIYGQEVDDELIFPDLEEIQEQRLQAQKLAILRRRQEQDAQLIREFNLGGNAQDFGLGNLGGANQGGFTI